MGEDDLPPYSFEHIFNTTGSHNISVTFFNNGCPFIYNLASPISIDGPIAGIAFSGGGVGCANNSTVSFSNTSLPAATGVTNYTWDFGDSSPTETNTGGGVSHTYASPGDYTVTLTAHGVDAPGCDDIATIVVNINSSTAVLAVAQNTVCNSTIVQFEDVSVTSSVDNIIYWEWNFGDGTTEIVHAPANPDVSHQFVPRDAPYNVSLTIGESDGCFYTSADVPVTVIGAVANFTYNPQACENEIVSFTDASSGFPTGTNIVNWVWDFGDPASGASNFVSGTPTPTHQFLAAGTYTVTLTVTTDNTVPGPCSFSKSYDITINEPPHASFTTDNNIYCTHLPTGFIDFTSTSTGTITNYSWNFDGAGTTIDGATATPQHHYNSDGLHVVTLTVTGPNGCSSTASKTIETVTPTIDVTLKGEGIPPYTFSCPPKTVEFEIVTTPNNVTFSNFYWEFGDGDVAFTQEPTHTYIFPGQYDVNLTAQSSAGCTFEDGLVNFITVNGPSGDFTYNPKDICYPESVTFEGFNLKDYNYIQWDFGDGVTEPLSGMRTVTAAELTTIAGGGTVNGVNLTSHEYTKAGIMYPYLVLKDNAGCKVSYPTTISPIRSSGLPVANFTWTGGGDICEDVQFNFEDLSTQDVATPNYLSPQINAWNWTFYDNPDIDPVLGISSVRNPVFEYVNPNLYKVNLQVTTAFGCTDSYFDFITIVEPNIDARVFLPSIPVCAGDEVQFQSDATTTSSTTGTGLPLVYEWTFLDESGNTVGTSTEEDPFFTFPYGGVFDVLLKVTDAVL